MVAVISGSGLGIFGSSVSALGGIGGSGNAAPGRGNDRVYVNTATGNLIVQSQDERLTALGLDLNLVRTYNSQGLLDDDNGDNWRLSVHQRVYNLTGIRNTDGSRITKVFGDGREVTYEYNSTRNAYVSSEGSDAHDTLTFSDDTWTWREGTTRVAETYDSSGRLTSARDADGNDVEYGYTGDLLTSIVDASNQETELVYEGNNLTAIRVIRDGVTQTLTTYDYDTDDRLVEVTVDLSPENANDALTYVTSYTYDGASNRIASISQGDGTTVEFEYQLIDGQHRVTSYTDGAGRITTFSYTQPTGTGGSYLQTEVTSNGVVTRYEQDESGRLIAVTVAPDSLALRTEYEYDTDGNVTAIIRDPEGLNRITRMTYDTNGNLLTQRDDLGNTLERTYDANNQLLTETVYAVRDPDGAGSATATVPQTTRYAYDGEQHLRFTVSPTGRVTEHRYNGDGERTTTFTYTGALYTGSAFDTASLETWAAAQDKTQLQRVNYTYLRGNLSTVTAFRTTDSTGAGAGTPSVTYFVYDQRGQLLQTVEARGSNPDGDDINVPYATTYSYDGLGRVLSVSQWNAAGNVSTTLTAYDDANRATRVTMANGLLTTTLYSLGGEVISVLNGTAATPSSFGATTYTYDANGRLRMQTDPTGVRQFFEYDAAGRRVAQIDGDGTLTELMYDDLDRVIKTVVYSTRVDSTTLASLVDANGQRTSVGLATIRAAADDTPNNDRIARNVYDAAGLLIYQIDATGAVTQYIYDGAGRITDEVRFANEVTIDRSVDQVLDGSITLTPSADDRRTRHFYDADGLRRGTLDAAGYLVEFIYDAAGRLVQQVGYADLTQTTYWSTGTLDELRGSVDVNAEQNVRSYFFYDGQGRRIGVLDAEGYLTETVYDVAGHVTQQTRFNRQLTYTPGSSTFATLRAAAVASPAPVSHTTSYQYDGAGRLLLETNYEGTGTEYTYDSVGRVISVTRAAGTTEARTTETRYDYLGRVLQELTAEGHARIRADMTAEDIDEIWQQYGVTYAYDVAGRRISATVRPNDSQTNVTLYYYDADGRLRFEISPLGEVKEFRYDAFGQLTDTIGYATALTSTTGLTGGLVNASLLTLVQNLADSARDSHVTTSYTVRGQVSSVLTAEGVQTNSYYNAFGQVETQEQALRAGEWLNVIYSYDRRGLLTETRRDPNNINAVEQRAYDAFGRLVSVIDPNGGVRESRYDRLGRTVLTIGADGAERTIGYDAFDRVLQMQDALGNITTFTYNDSTRTTVVRTPEGIETTTINNRHGQTLFVTAAENTTEYSYDLNGALTGISDNLGTLESRTYDRAGRQLTSTDARTVTTTFTYDAANRVLTRIVDSGTGGLQLTTEYHYDALGRVDLMTDATGTQTRTTYDRDGRVTEVAIDPDDLNIRTTYAYDLAGRRILVTEGAGSDNPRITSYEFDALGRRIVEVVDPGEDEENDLNLATLYEYDDNGNVTRKIIFNVIYYPEGGAYWDEFHTVFAYDAEGRLKYTVDTDGGVTSNDYDDEGRLVQTTRHAEEVYVDGLYDRDVVVTAAQIEANIIPSQWDRTEQYVYDRDSREVYRVDAMGGVTLKEYDAAGNVIHQRMYSDRIDVAEYRDLQSVADQLMELNDDRQSWSTFDVRNQLLFSIDALGSVVAYEYDNGGNVTRRTAYATPINTTGTLDTPALQAWADSHSSANDQVTRTWYDAAGRAQYVVDAKGYLTEYQYDELGRVTEEIKFADPPTIVGDVVTPSIDADNDQHTISDYDAAGRLISVTDALQVAESYRYDAVGNRIEYINRNGARWTYVYDANRRLIEEHSPQVDIDRMVRVERDEGGSAMGPDLVAEATVHDSIITRLEYDRLGNVTARIEAYGTEDQRTTHYQYDELGRQVGVTHPYDRFYGRGATSYDVMRDESGWYWDWEVPYGYEDWQAPQSETTYDTLGNAIVNTDVTGGTTRKYYDQLGRVRYILDAEQYVTEYRYDTFGNQTEMIRYADRLLSDDAWSTEELEQQLQANPNQDRKLVSTYDLSNRLVSVTQPAALVFDPSVGSAGGQLAMASAVTTNTYDAFGRLIKQSKLASLSGATADTYYYYDERDAKVGEIDALGYVTTHEYDAVGNLTVTTEYADALSSGAWNESGFSVPGASPGEDRKTEWAYDRLNRKISETRVDVVHHTLVNGVPPQAQLGNQVTTFGYDAVGNLTRRTEASGVETYTYYDALGRQIAMAGNSRNVGGVNALTPLTTMKRDAHGNLVEQTIWALGTSSADEDGFADPTASSSDRVTRFLVNSHNKVIQTQDAMYGNHFALYDQAGRLGREWSQIDKFPGSYYAQSRVTAYRYDRLGRLIDTIENGHGDWEVGTNKAHRRAVYNSFGEVTAKGLDDVLSEHFEYDQAGRLWRSNGDDGVYKVYLYNLLGQATAEIRSQTASLVFYSAETAASVTAGVLRTETRYDLLGRVLEQRKPQFITSSPSQTGIQALALDFGMSHRLGPNNPDAVYYLVPAVEGYGEEYISNEYLIFDPANGGWYYTPDGSYYQDPTYHLESSRYISWTPPQEYDPNVRVRAVNITFEYRPAGNPNGDWVSLRVTDLPDGSVGVDSDGLADGQYEYRVKYARVNQVAAYATSIGTMNITGSTATFTDTTVASLAADNVTPVAVTTQIPINTQFRDADFQIGGFSGIPAINSFVYSRIVEGTVVSYVPDRGATVAEGGGYYLTASGYVLKPDYNPDTSLFVRWNRPADATLTPTFQYRPIGSAGDWQTLTTDTVGTQFSAAVGNLPDGRFEFRVMYTAPGQTTPVATADGVFEIAPTEVGADLVVNINPPDNAGTVAPIGNRPPGSSNIISNVTSSAHVDAYSGGQMLMVGDNTVNVRFPSISGPVRVEIEYLTLAISPEDHPGPAGAGWPATARRISLAVANASAAGSGINLTWRDPIAGQTAGGISQVVNVRVYALDADGNATLQYASDPATAASIGGTQMSWTAPFDTTIVPTFNVRRPGAASWTPMNVTRVGGDYTIDVASLGTDTWEYEVTYTTASGVLRSQATGTFVVNAGSSVNIHEDPGSGPYPIEPVADVSVIATGPVEFNIGNSAHQSITTPSYVIVNGQMQQHQPLGTTWDEQNQLNVTWDNLGILATDTVKVEIDYTSARRYAFNYTSSEPPHWEENAAWVPGQLTRKTLEVTDASTGKLLTWEDDDASLIGGIQEVHRIRVYTRDANGQWVLRYDRDAAAPKGGTSMYWSAPDDPEVDVTFEVRQVGQTNWESPTRTLQGGRYSVDLSTLATGNYEYRIKYSVTNGSVTTPTAVTRGSFSIDTSQFSDSRTQVIDVEQSNVKFDADSVDFDSVSWDGTNITWSQAPVSGDTVVVRTRTVGSSTWQEQTISGSGPDFTHAFTAAAGQAYEFEISYTHSGESTPYATTSGVLNSHVAAQLKPMTVAVTQQSVATTSIAPIPGIWTLDGALSWSAESTWGSSVTFRYRRVGGEWINVAPTPLENGYGVDLRAVPGGNYEYEIAHKVTSTSSLPTAFASGTFVIGASGINGGVSIEDRTAYVRTVTQLSTDNVPTQTQQVDRWGNVTSLTDVFGRTTYYRYNQLGLLIETQQPEVDVVNTANGVSTPTQAPISKNFYDLSGRLIATQDANGIVNSVVYNTAGQILEEHHADGGVKRFEYDVFGQQVQVTDEGGYSTRNVYDRVGNLVQVRKELSIDAFENNASDVLTSSYTYDEARQRRTETNAAGETISYSYDVRGNLERRTSNRGFVTTYEYDLLGNKILERDANYDYDDWDGYNDSPQLTWEYDYFGRVIAHSDLGGAQYRYLYNAGGQLIQQTNSLGQNLIYFYDSAAQLERIVDQGVAVRGADVVSSSKITEYGYDLAGRRVLERTTVDGLVHQNSWTSYDALGRIATVTDPDFKVTYSYDLVGNRTRIQGEYYDHTGYQYGNLHTEDLWYKYDSMNRVVVSQGLNINGTVSINASQGTELTYNAKGERVSARTQGQYLETTIIHSIENGTSVSYNRLTGLFTERYTYDGLGRLLLTSRDSPTYIVDEFNGTTELITSAINISQKTYDGASRVITEVSWSLPNNSNYMEMFETTTTYDGDGRPMEQITNRNNIRQTRVIYGDARWYSGRETLAGSLLLRNYVQDTAPRYAMVSGGSSSSSSGSTSSRGSRPVYGGLAAVTSTGASRWRSFASVWLRGHFEGTGFDEAGNLHGYTVEIYRPHDGKYLYKTEHKLKYRKGETYQQIQEQAFSSTTVHNISLPGLGWTTRTYNVNGELVAFVDEKDNNKNRFFANNAEGQVLTAVQGDFDGQSNRLTISSAFNNAVTRSGINVKAQHFFSANGQTIGSFGQLKDRDNAFTANFDINYTPVSANYPSDAPDQYVVQAGDTLRTVAARIFGDASLWYIIAEENALTEPDAALLPGTALRITNNVVTLSNAAGSFKPFDMSEALGDTTPTQPAPKPKKSRWGILGQILVIIVAIVVAYFTGVWVGDLIGGFAGAVIGSGVGAAAGSIASQGVAIALDMQDSFSWKAVGAAALSGLIAPGLPGGTEGWAAVARGAFSSAVNQGVNIALGLQEEFNWKAVAAAAVAAPIAQWAGTQISTAVGAAAGEAAGKFAGGFTQGIINQVSYAAFTGGKLNWTQMAADAFGNALGNAIADELPKPASATRTSPRPLNLDEDIEAGIERTRARNETSLLAMEMPRLNNNPTNVIVSPAFALTQDEQRTARSRQSVAEVPAVPEVQVTAQALPEAIAGIEEVTVTAPRMSAWEARAYDAREALRTTLSEIMAQHRREQDARNSVEAEMSAGERALVSLGGIMYNGYQSVKSGVVGIVDLAGAAYEWDKRVIGDLLHGDFRAAAGEYADLIGLGAEKAKALITGAQNLGAVLGDAESRQMLVDFAQEYYGASSQVTQSELLGMLPMELLIAAGTAGAGQAINAAGVPQRIGGAIKSLSEAMSGTRLARMAEGGAVDKLLYGARVREGLPGTAGVPIPGRPTPAQLENLTVKHDVEFAVTYKLGPGKGGGGGQYFLHSGDIGSVRVPLEGDRMLIYHTHPGSTAWASPDDMDVLKAFRAVGSPQRSSLIVPTGKDVVRFGTDYERRDYERR